MQTLLHLSVVFETVTVKGWLVGAVYILQSGTGLAFLSKARDGTLRPVRGSALTDVM